MQFTGTCKSSILGGTCNPKKYIFMRKVLIVFGQMSDSDVDWIAQSGERIHVKAGAVLIPREARVEHLYIVLDGELVIRAGSGVSIATLGSGEIVGEMSLVDPAPTTVSVEVEHDSTLFRVSHDVVRKKLRVDAEFASHFYLAICIFLTDRMRNTTRRLGYGEAKFDTHADDELNENLLDNVHAAGARFDRMLKRLSG
jgi:CRP-like cAMP-binding protein